MPRRIPPYMVMITQFEKSYNPKTEKIHISGNKYPVCPKCDKTMAYRDTCDRHGLNADAICQWYVLRRFKCVDCNNIHREIPDFLFPYKHYEADVIQAAIDGNKDGIAADESTIRNWRNQWYSQETHIRLILLSLLIQLNNEKPKLIGFNTNIIISIRKKYSRWLAFVIKALTNNNFPVYTQFAFCHYP